MKDEIIWFRIQLTNSQKEELLNEEEKNKSARLLKRIQIIKLKDQWYKNKEIKKILNISSETCKKWIKIYIEEGLKWLLTTKNKWRVWVLTDEQKRIILERVKNQPFKDIKEAQDFICKEFWVSFSKCRVGELLKKNWISYKKPSLVPWNRPDEEVQNNFIDNTYKPLLKEGEENKKHVLFSDPTHKVYNTITWSCWQLKWKENTVKLSSNTWRRRITILWAINIITKKLTSIVTESNCDAEAIKIELQELRNEYNDGKEIVLILDNARYHYAEIVREEAKRLNITFNFLPPYCPNLNLIERVWKFLKKKLKNIYFPKFENFYDKILCFCQNFKDYEDEINTLLGQKFQII